MPAPEISCVIPTYENPALAERCIRAVLDQASIATEVIVSDDSRSDAIRLLAERLATRSPQLRYAAGARTGNPVDNWNAGLDRATAAHAVVVHHDEILVDPGYLRRAMDALEPGGARLAVAGVQVEGDSQFRSAARLARLLRLPAWTLYVMNWIGPTAAVVFPTNGSPRFDRRLVWTVDVDFYARLFERFSDLARDEAVCVRSVSHGGQITARIDPRRLSVEELRLLAGDERPRLAGWRGRFALAAARARLALQR